MTKSHRTFEDKPATRERVPLLVGLVGPSGSGKTYSALRLAAGIQTVSGGDIYLVDTEARRALHYADKFAFRHIEFNAPFGSLDYLAALQHCVQKGAGVVIVDSMSHEHEGPGGLIDLQDQELERLAGSDYQKRERVKMLAWQKPKAARRALINGILQLSSNFVFCFRAREKTKPVKRNGKTEIEEMGFMPIAGEEFLFEMTANCLLLPKSGGVPTWKSEQMGERAVMKLPNYLAPYFTDGEPLNEDVGRKLAEWAKGTGLGAPGKAATTSARSSAPPPGAFLIDAYVEYVKDTVATADDPQALAEWWNSETQKRQRAELRMTPEQASHVRGLVMAKIEALKNPPPVPVDAGQAGEEVWP